MKTTFQLTIPGAFSGIYAQRESTEVDLFSAATRLLRSLPLGSRSAAKRYASFVQRVRAIELHAGAPVDIAAVRVHLARPQADEGDYALAFAAVARVFTKTLNRTPYDLQIAAARALLDGQLAEMPTGEGKTLVAALAACVAALAGAPVHVLTANDYLVERDAAWLAPAAEALGLTVGHVATASSPEQRRAAYGCHVVYGTAKEVVFDYLRDRIALGAKRSDLEMRVNKLTGNGDVSPRLTLRGLYFAIVDEADSILLDEARTPLVLARAARTIAHEQIRAGMAVAQTLREDDDFLLDRNTLAASLLPSGIEKSRAGKDATTDPRLAQELVETALGALNFYTRDREYVVRAGKVEIVDPNTGRVAEGRAWSQGLHQMIELKEGCELTDDQDTIARLTYQRFFPRYHRLCGLSGTLAESSMELGVDYGLPMLRVSERLASRRVRAAPRLYLSQKAKWRSVLAETKRLHAAGRPVLIGTGSVAESEFVSALLKRMELPHVVLNACQDKDEAALIADAGRVGSITVATNMAGRGTDIHLDARARELGGLHVLAAHVNESARIDRQLWGRCARQGDPGSVSVAASLDDTLFAQTLPRWVNRSVHSAFRNSDTLPIPLARALIGGAQWWAERRSRAARQALRRHDEQMDKRLSFGRISE